MRTQCVRACVTVVRSSRWYPSLPGPTCTAASTPASWWPTCRMWRLARISPSQLGHCSTSWPRCASSRELRADCARAPCSEVRTTWWRRRIAPAPPRRRAGGGHFARSTQCSSPRQPRPCRTSPMQTRQRAAASRRPAASPCSSGCCSTPTRTCVSTPPALWPTFTSSRAPWPRGALASSSASDHTIGRSKWGTSPPSCARSTNTLPPPVCRLHGAPAWRACAPRSSRSGARRCATC
mmetsp:Transcript_11810/g.31762  ORF Transcript_11810/g.31762 Transcript_11810/m.31762 type:complete len:237 (+) Transcript_11810:3-713(+)